MVLAIVSNTLCARLHVYAHASVCHTQTQGIFEEEKHVTIVIKPREAGGGKKRLLHT